MSNCPYCGSGPYVRMQSHYNACGSKAHHDNEAIRENTRFIEKQKFKEEAKKQQEKFQEETKKQQERHERIEKLRKEQHVRHEKIRQEARAQAFVEFSLTPPVVIKNYHYTNVDNSVNSHNSVKITNNILLIQQNTDKICREIDDQYSSFLNNCIKAISHFKSTGVDKKQALPLLIESIQTCGSEEDKIILKSLLNQKVESTVTLEDIPDDEANNQSKTADESEVDPDIIEKHEQANLEKLTGLLNTELTK
ncbi:MAG: hypothetical protein WD512_02655 [Candidatus Paceibacterota bacterium]